MSTLNAVNEMLGAIGEPPVNALDTGGNSIAGEAETILDRERERRLARGWVINTDRDVEMKLPDLSFDNAGVSGEFVYGETVQGQTSGAMATFLYVDPADTRIYLWLVSGTFTLETVQGLTSGATALVSAINTSIASGRHAVGVATIRLMPSVRESKQLVMRGGFVYHVNDSTFDYDSSIYVDTVTLLDLDDLTPKLAAFVIKSAAVEFQRYKKRGRVDDSFARDEAALAKIEAVQENNDLDAVNLLDTTEARRIRGNRNDWHGRRLL